MDCSLVIPRTRDGRGGGVVRVRVVGVGSVGGVGARLRRGLGGASLGSKGEGVC